MATALIIVTNKRRIAMPYSLIVYTPPLPPRVPRVDKPLGPDWFLATYWTGPAKIMGLPCLSSMAARAKTAHGFILSGQELIDFASEVAQLNIRWAQASTGIFHGGFEMVAPNNFSGYLSDIEAIAREAFARGDVLMVV